MEKVSNKYKTYVDVVVLDRKDSTRKQLSVEWLDGAHYEIQKVLDVRPKASQKAGGVGIRFTCIIEGKERYLFYEKDRWFVEAKQE